MNYHPQNLEIVTGLTILDPKKISIKILIYLKINTDKIVY